MRVILSVFSAIPDSTQDGLGQGALKCNGSDMSASWFLRGSSFSLQCLVTIKVSYWMSLTSKQACKWPTAVLRGGDVREVSCKPSFSLVSLGLVWLCGIASYLQVPQCLSFSPLIFLWKKKTPENTTQGEELKWEEGSKSFVNIVCVKPPAGADLSWYIFAKIISLSRQNGKSNKTAVKPS